MDSPLENNLYSEIRQLIIESRSLVGKTVNFVSVIQNWEIGHLIVEDEQAGSAKAGYGKYILRNLSEKLTLEFGNNYDERNLRYYRKFYLTFPIQDALRSKFQSVEIKNITIWNALRSKSAISIHQALIDKSHPVFQILRTELSWTHYRLLLGVENQKAREFYINETITNNWSTRALERQINSLYYQRILSSKNKLPVIDEMKEKTRDLKPEDILKDPYILEFLELKENIHYKESELEQALIDKLSSFLLELGKGFAFVARQKQISTESKHYYIDLVFYNYLLKCFVIIDLKTGELTHQDIGQMDMYVRIYEEKFKAEGDNPTIGLILCTKKDQTVVKYSVLNENNQLFASKYQLYLPTEKELIDEIEREKIHFEQHLKEK
jgi:predicted nuclease of restriction endonuclease-like (RecB) superfamily